MPPTDDSALLRQFAENHSNEAFAALVTRHINLVYSVALRQVGNPHHAEEITQAVFIILAKKSSSLRHDKALSSWLFQTARLTANNFIRGEMRRHRREQEAYMQTIVNEPAREIWTQIAPLLDSAVAALNEKDRRAILMRFYEDRNLQQVGIALGINEEAAKKRVTRALEKLRKFFAKRGVSSTAAVIAGMISANSVQAAPIGLAKTISAVAITKSAVASTSTSTLVKGALKIMAWTKTKTAIAGAMILALAATTVVVTHSIRNRSHQPVILNKALFIYAGYQTPQATMRTMLAAMLDGDPEAYLACCAPEEKARREKDWAGKSRETLSAKSKNELRTVTAIRILDQTTDSADRIFITAQLEGSGKKERLQFNKIDNEWKFAGSVGL